MFKRLAACAALTVSAASIMVAGANNANAAGPYTLLAEASNHGYTARLWLNNKTRGIHAEGRNLKRLDAVELILDRLPGLRVVADRDTASLNTGDKYERYRSYKACAGFITTSHLVCTNWHYHKD